MPLPGAFAGGSLGKTTATLGTAWYGLVPPYYTSSTGFSAYTCLLNVNLTNGNTVTNVTVMRPIGATTAASAATTASNTVTLSADPGNNAGGLYVSSATNNNIAANDIIVTQNVDGTFTQYVVGAWNGTTKVATVTAATLTANISSGARVWNYGVNTDTDPSTGAAFPIVPNSVAANATGTVFNSVAGGFRGYKVGDPLLVYCGNATNAIILNYAEYVYDRGF